MNIGEIVREIVIEPIEQPEREPAEPREPARPEPSRSGSRWHRERRASAGRDRPDPGVEGVAPFGRGGRHPDALLTH